MLIVSVLEKHFLDVLAQEWTERGHHELNGSTEPTAGRLVMPLTTDLPTEPYRICLIIYYSF